jgi:hypothetical protein
MNSLTILLAPLALLVPALAQLPGEPAAEREVARAAPEADIGFEPATTPAPPADDLQQAHRAPVQNQVSIEQRVIIRIAPTGPDPRQRMSRPVLPGALPENLEEKKVKDCVPVAAIAAIRPGEGNRLMLLLRDRQIFTAVLEKSCNPSEFYSGAYVERNADGKLCPKREVLQSRTGSKCEIVRINRLVPRD